MDVTLLDGRLRFGARLVVSFHRTLRLPEAGGPYPLPPGFGLLPIAGSAQAGFLVPLHPREALWIGFSAALWKPNAVKVIAGGINAVSGLADDGAALADPQNYLVCPDQPWLDGCNIGGGLIRQFVAMPLGQGYGLGATAAGGERGGLEIIGFEPRPGHFSDVPPPPAPAGPMRMMAPRSPEMTLGAGARLHQKLYPDRFGRDIWDPASAMRAGIRLVDARDWPALTGAAVPDTPINADSYAQAGLPWFDLDDADDATLAPATKTAPGTVGQRDRERGITATERPIVVTERKITVIGRRKATTTKKGE